MNHRKKFIIIFFLLLICLILSTKKGNIIPDRHVLFFEDDTLNATVCVKGGVFLKQGHTTGYHYELLKKFSKNQKCQIDVKPFKGTDQWADLIGRYTDILVVDPKDTIPDMYQTEVISSMEINDENHVWVVRKDDILLLQQLNYWIGYYKQTREYRDLNYKYYTKYGSRPVSFSLKNNVISPYDHIIKVYANKINLDWRLLASLICQESQFNPNAKSLRGAQGLMQIKDETARFANIENVFDPEQNIMAGTMLIKRLKTKYEKEGIDSANIIKFILAAYNAGEGRIDDLRAFAIHKNMNPNDWNSIVEVIPMMRQKELLPKGLLKFGTFSGKETVKFVNEVLNRYEEYCAFTSP